MENLSPKISVIIPIYNAEKYLEKCLDSIIGQSMKELEIICVDDGSTDSSLMILNEYQEKDSRITIIKQENLHAGVARNKGLAIATGEYIHFMDADDWIEEGAYGQWYTIAKTNSADVCICFFKRFDNETGEILAKMGTALNKQYIGESNLNKNPKYFIYGLVPPWNKIYCRKFLQKHEIYFDTLICVNDRSFYIQTLLHAERIIVVSEYWINCRRNNPASLTGETRLKNYDCHFHSFEKIWKLIETREDSIKRMILDVSITDMLVFYRKSLGGSWEDSVRKQLSDFLKNLDVSLLGNEMHKYKWYKEYLELTGFKKVSEVQVVQNKRTSFISKIKKVLSHFLPLPYRRAMEQNRELLLRLSLLDRYIDKIEIQIADLEKEKSLRGEIADRKFCPVCQSQVDKFLPFGVVKRKNARCPYCFSLERHRALWFYFENHTDLFTNKNKKSLKILHFAPEKIFYDKFSNSLDIDYYPVDFDSSFSGFIGDGGNYILRDIVDIQNIQYQNNMFDVIICNHILEHIPNEQSAITELLRVLKKDGQAYISVPVYDDLEVTLENHTYNTAELRKKYYGQSDHVRKYGRDFPQRLTNAGFDVEIIYLNKYLTEHELICYGMRNTEKIYKCTHR